MSLHERILSIYLTPHPRVIQIVPKTAVGYFRLLFYWSLRNPLELQEYVSEHILCPTAEMQVNVAPWESKNWRQRIYALINLRWLASYVPAQKYLVGVLLFTLIILSQLESVVILISQFWLEPEQVLTNFIVSSTLGATAILFFLVLGIYSGELAIFTLWSIYFGLGLPLLHLHEALLRSLGAQANFWILAEFSLFCGLFFGAMLNNVTSVFMRNISGILPIHLFLLVPIVPFTGTITLYHRQFTQVLEMQWVIVCILIAIVSAVAGFLRIDDFLIAQILLPRPKDVAEVMNKATPRQRRILHNQLYRTIPRVTYLMPPKLRHIIENWLTQDWDRAIFNLHQLWQFTNLYHYLIWSVQKDLDRSNSSELLLKVDALCHERLHWRLQDFITLQKLKFPAFRKIMSLVWHDFLTSRRSDRENRGNRILNYRIDRFREGHEFAAYEELEKPWQSALAACIYLRENQLTEAAETFDKIADSDDAREMALLCRGFDRLLREEKLLHSGPRIKLPQRPKTVKHPSSWDALTIFSQVLHKAWLYRRCQPSTQTLLRNELREQMQHLLQWQSEYHEKDAIIRLAELWHEELEGWYQEDERLQLSEVENPFIYNEPLHHPPTFTGRRVILQQIYQANQRGNVHPLVIYGLPKAGKTSLLHQVVGLKQNPIDMVHVHINDIVRGPKVIDKLIAAICQEIQVTLRRHHQSITDIELKLKDDSLRVLQEEIRNACRDIGNHMLVLTLDDFDEVNIAVHPSKPSLNLHTSTPSIESFIEILWHLATTVANFNIMFVTKHPPTALQSHQSWMNHAFFSATQCIAIPNLSQTETTQLLQNAVPTQIVRFTSTTMALVFRLTNGQPFLVQLLGNCLIQNFNRCVLAKVEVDPVFTDEDVMKIVESQEFKQHSHRYFQRLMHNLARTEARSHLILWTVAKARAGLCLIEIQRDLALYPQTINNVEAKLDFLQTCLLLKNDDGRWCIQMGLLRQWLCRQRRPN